MIEVKLRAGSKMVPAKMIDDDGVIEFRFGYNKHLIDEMKAFDGARWNPDKKAWTVKKNHRNAFQLKYLLGGNPYAPYDTPLLDFTTNRPLKTHQILMTRHGITYRQMILAAEMGTGKSLAAIEIIEWAEKLFAQINGGKFQAYWVAPKSALRSVELELRKWRCDSNITLHTYESLKTKIKNWNDGDKAPFVVIGDESSRVKSPTAQRSQGMAQLADGVRDDWGDDGFVILMSGTPAPKSPADWWMQCEIAQPGFLREGTPDKFKKRLGLITQKESIQGGVYPHLITWLDDENKCATCGQYANGVQHDPKCIAFGETYHAFVKSVNEVTALYNRMKGLVHVVFKKDCLDLPDKHYEIIHCKPSQSTLRAASIIVSRSTTAIGAMILLRELSDGFQYEDIENTNPETCPVCHGDKVIVAPAPDDYDIDFDTGERIEVEQSEPVMVEQACPRCNGVGQIITFKRVATQLPCPKDDVVKDLLDQYEDVGRTVFFGGFTGSLDRLVSLCLQQQWAVIRVDGKGWWCSIDGINKAVDMLEMFQDPNSEHIKVAFIGQPSSSGMGLTLTRSPMIAYYSNDFNAESRIQSEDRCHRMGMDINRGCTIYDIIHLDTDEKVLDNLKKKRELQAMSLGEIKAAFAQTSEERVL